MSLPERVQLTYDDYVLFPEDGRRHEIIEGEHYVTPSPASRHQRIVQYLSYKIGWFVREQGLGNAFPAPMDVVLSPANVVQPDYFFVASDGAAEVTEPNIQGPPDLVVEVLSPGTRRTDEVVKRKLYERFGVREYWTVDLEVDVLRIRRLDAGAYGPAVEHSAEDDSTVTTPLLPDWSMSARELFS